MKGLFYNLFLDSTRRMVSIRLKFFKSERGSTLVWVTLLMPVLMGFCAFVIDIGRVVLEKQRLQNAIDAACLAGAKDLPNIITAETTAYTYMDSNGCNSSDILGFDFSSSNYTIKIFGSKEVEYTFAKILGFDSITVHPSAAATKTIERAFDYAIFSGSSTGPTGDLDLSNKIEVVGGMVHSNYTIKLPSSYNITGGCEAVQGSNGTTIKQAQLVDMPILSSLLPTAPRIIIGDWTYDGSSISSGIRVEGNLTIYSRDIVGKTGSIIATGTITYNGSGSYAVGSNAVCLYSLSSAKDAITLNGSGGNLYGIVYAPNGGIKFDGSDTTVYGRLIANTIDLNGKGVSVINNPNDLDSIPKTHVVLIE